MYTIMQYLKNYFFVFKEYGEYYILDNTIQIRGNYKQGQYILIKNSILNDGVYKVIKVKDDILTLEGELNTEVFTGYVCSLSVPKDFIRLCEDINKFNQKQIRTDIVSESFPGGYSYSKATVNGELPSWKDVFKTELYMYRKIYDNFRRVDSI